MNKPEFVFNLAIPISRPSEEEIAVVSDEKNLEPHLNKLLEVGYLSREELATYLKFGLTFAGSTPFLLDEFLRVYRENVVKAQ